MFKVGNGKIDVGANIFNMFFISHFLELTIVEKWSLKSIRMTNCKNDAYFTAY